MKIAPSILSADFSKLGEQIKAIENCGADLLHIDVMDGHFVPNISIGPVVISSIKDQAKIPFDVHLMISEPQKYVDDFISAGADMVSFHIEAMNYSNEKVQELISLIKERDVKAGIAINPGTPLSQITDILNDLDFVLIMSVYPGFAGQTFIEEVIEKVKEIKNLIKNGEIKKDLLIEIDGGINGETAKSAIDAGVDILVAGSYIFNGNITENIKNIREASK